MGPTDRPAIGPLIAARAGGGGCTLLLLLLLVVVVVVVAVFCCRGRPTVKRTAFRFPRTISIPPEPCPDVQ